MYRLWMRSLICRSFAGAVVWSMLALLLVVEARAGVEPSPWIGRGQDPTNPAVLVGFDPQPEPPGSTMFVDLSNPMMPMFSVTNEAGHAFTILFGLNTSGGPARLIIPPDPVSPEGHFEFQAQVGGDTFFDVFFDISSPDGPINQASWRGFNPQPDPPGFPEATVFEFEIMGNTSATLALQVLNDGTPIAFTAVPEPGTLLLLTSGFGGLGFIAWRRRRKLP